MNKKADRNESNSKVKSQQNTKFYRYSAISDLSISGETFIPEKKDNWIPQNPFESYYSDHIKNISKMAKTNTTTS